jgi:hypothetical protein
MYPNAPGRPPIPDEVRALVEQPGRDPVRRDRAVAPGTRLERHPVILGHRQQRGRERHELLAGSEYQLLEDMGLSVFTVRARH